MIEAIETVVNNTAAPRGGAAVNPQTPQRLGRLLYAWDQTVPGVLGIQDRFAYVPASAGTYVELGRDAPADLVVVPGDEVVSLFVLRWEYHRNTNRIVGRTEAMFNASVRPDPGKGTRGRVAPLDAATHTDEVRHLVRAARSLRGEAAAPAPTAPVFALGFKTPGHVPPADPAAVAAEFEAEGGAPAGDLSPAGVRWAVEHRLAVPPSHNPLGLWLVRHDLFGDMEVPDDAVPVAYYGHLHGDSAPILQGRQEAVSGPNAFEAFCRRHGVEAAPLLALAASGEAASDRDRSDLDGLDRLIQAYHAATLPRTPTAAFREQVIAAVPRIRGIGFTAPDAVNQIRELYPDAVFAGGPSPAEQLRVSPGAEVFAPGMARVQIVARQPGRFLDSLTFGSGRVEAVMGMLPPRGGRRR